ncbi:MAG TPA: DUF72 domain-containing protein [Gemmatimonadales bacterium]|jgi:uncharacterized protein YecE (DUF72 family)|nr:DUF72 domain-containing protein [Gemmatimonadales bacterium]
MAGASAEPHSGADFERLRERIPPSIRFGTSTWNYPGWRGLVYHEDYGPKGAAAKMLREYAAFPLFGTVGVDSSFYGPPTEAVLRSYAEQLPPDFPCVSKVWSQITVHTFTKAQDPDRAGKVNPDFLNPDLFIEEIYEPYQRHFSANTGPFVFEFQTIAKSSGIGAQRFADRLDEFLSALPREGQYAVEIRNDDFLTPMYFAVLREHGVAHVFNSWTRMPPIGHQLDLPGSIPASFIVARALLRPGRTYNEAVDAFAPYDRIREPNPKLRRDLVRLVQAAVNLRIPAYLLVNNRTEGSAPLTIAAIAEML